jgi:protein disulfide-isomerase
MRKIVGVALAGFLSLLSSARAEDDTNYGIDNASIDVPVTLRASNFHEETAKGTWFIDFFSPYCPHCTAFAPTWQQLYEELGGKKLGEERNFHIAKVDCVEDGDLCAEQGVEMYPTLQLLENGAFIEKFGKGAATLDDLIEYVQIQLGDIKVSSSRSGKTTTTDIEPPHIYTNDGESYSFNETSFDDMVLNSKTPWIIKYFSPYCPHCRSMKGAWLDMAKKLKGEINVGEVNCDKESDLCKTAKVSQIPGIFFYYGSSRTQYESLTRTADDMEAFARAALQASQIVEVSSEAELTRSIQHPSDLTLLYFYDDATVTEDFDALRKVAIHAVDKANIFRTQSKTLAELAGVQQYPALYAVLGDKKWIQYPGRTPKDIRNVKQISEWIANKWMLKVPRLTYQNAENVLSISRYNVIALLDPTDVSVMNGGLRSMRDLAWQNLEREDKLVSAEVQLLRADKQKEIELAELKDDDDGVELAKNIKIQPKLPPSVGFLWVDIKDENNVAWLTRRLRVPNLANIKIIVTDESQGLYYVTGAEGKLLNFNVNELLAEIVNVVDRPSILVSSVLFVGPRSYFKLARRQVAMHPFYFGVGFLAFVALYYLRRRSHHIRASPILPVSYGKQD